MTTVETRTTPKPTNGTTPKAKRERKPLNARTAAMKIVAILEALPTDMREKSLSLARTIVEAT